MPTKRKYDDYVLDRLVELGDSVPDDERVESAFKGVADTLAEEGHPGLNYTVLASYYWQLKAGKHYSQRDEEDDSNQATIARKAQRLQQKEHRHKWGRKQTHKWTEDEDDELENSIDGFGGVGAVGWHKIFNEFVANDADTRGGITESAMRAHWGQMQQSSEQKEAQARRDKVGQRQRTALFKEAPKGPEPADYGGTTGSRKSLTRKVKGSYYG